jgi:hypothetical protein
VLLESVKQLKTQDTSSVTEQRLEYSQRKKLAHLTNAKESLSWGTPNTMDVLPSRSYEAMKRQATNGQRKNRQRPGNLREQVDPLMCQAYKDAQKEANQKNWATPQVTDIRTDVRKPEERSAKAKKGGCKNLREEVMQPQNWPTATARDWKGCGNATTRKDGKSRMDTLEAVAKYGHPDQAKLNKSGKNQESWGTPRTSQAMSAKITENLVNRQMGNLEEQQGRQSIGGKLNPNWVEQLMGLPVGWTDLGSWETE